EHHTGLLAAQPDADGLRAVFTTWITLPQRAVDELVPALLDGCVAHVRARGEFTGEARTLLDLGERYPGDAGVLAALLLNRVTLAPGECLYQPAGSPHSYLSGAGVELMANSDNVLRCGLTPKHVDVPELLRIVRFEPRDPGVLRPEAAPDGEELYETPTDEFRLSRYVLPAAGTTHDLTLATPQILLCTAGS